MAGQLVYSQKTRSLLEKLIYVHFGVQNFCCSVEKEQKPFHEQGTTPNTLTITSFATNTH